MNIKDTFKEPKESGLKEVTINSLFPYVSFLLLKNTLFANTIYQQTDLFYVFDAENYVLQKKMDLNTGGFRH